MTIAIQKAGEHACAVVHSDRVILTDVQSALDFLVSIRHETGCDRVALNKAAITERFFDLSTRVAGEILQKFVQYQMQFAVYGDYTQYTSKALRDFIYESNQGRHVFFAADADEALLYLSK